MRLNLGAKTLNLAVAAFAAASLAFAVFAMPRELFEQLVATSGIPSLVSGAEAPLGAKARLVTMIGGGAAIFLLVWLILSLIDGLGRIARAAPAQDDFFDLEFEPPRLRRADAHPDAPSRHPIRARREFGEPVVDLMSIAAASNDEEDAKPVESVAGEELSTEVPAFPAAVVDQAEASAPTAAELDAADAASDTALGDDAETEEAQAELEELELAGFEECLEPMVTPEEPGVPVAAVEEPETSAAFAEPLDLEAFAAEAPLPIAEPVGQTEVVEPEAQHHDLDDDQHEGVGQEIPVARIRPPEERGESISNLLQRLDAGFGECEWPLAGAASQPPLKALDARLRSALDELQKMASRSGN